MGNQSSAPCIHSNTERSKKFVHWKSAEKPSPPGKPMLLPVADQDVNCIQLKWDRPKTDGGSQILGYIIEQRKMGTSHWIRSTQSLVPFTEFSLSGLEPGWRYQFRIIAENIVGKSAPSELSDPLTVTLQKTLITVPHFIKELKDVTVIENERIEMKVIVSGKPSPEFNWFKDEIRIFSSRRMKIINDNEASTLIIYQSAFTDEGEIKCTATNRVGYVATKCNLRIISPPKIRLPKQYEDGIIVEANEKLKLKASLAGKPHPSVVWSHEGQPIRNDNRYEIITSENCSLLKIENVERSDRGEYTIRASNSLGDDLASVLVTVTSKPSPPEKLQFTMSFGRSVTLTWMAPQDDGGCKIGNYIIEYFREGWNVWLKAATTRKLSMTLHDLIEGSKYKFRVKAENPYGMSEPSEVSETLFIPDLKRSIVEPVNTEFISEILPVSPKIKTRFFSRKTNKTPTQNIPPKLSQSTHLTSTISTNKTLSEEVAHGTTKTLIINSKEIKKSVTFIDDVETNSKNLIQKPLKKSESTQSPGVQKSEFLKSYEPHDNEDSCIANPIFHKKQHTISSSTDKLVQNNNSKSQLERPITDIDNTTKIRASSPLFPLIESERSYLENEKQNSESSLISSQNLNKNENYLSCVSQPKGNHSSNEFVLVFQSMEKSEENKKQPSFDLEFAEALSQPPYFSDPNLPFEKLNIQFLQMRRAVSSTELLFQKTMDKFYDNLVTNTIPKTKVKPKKTEYSQEQISTIKQSFDENEYLQFDSDNVEKKNLEYGSDYTTSTETSSEDLAEKLENESYNCESGRIQTSYSGNIITKANTTESNNSEENKLKHSLENIFFKKDENTKQLEKEKLQNSCDFHEISRRDQHTTGQYSISENFKQEGEFGSRRSSKNETNAVIDYYNDIVKELSYLKNREEGRNFETSVEQTKSSKKNFMSSEKISDEFDPNTSTKENIESSSIKSSKESVKKQQNFLNTAGNEKENVGIYSAEGIIKRKSQKNQKSNLSLSTKIVEENPYHSEDKIKQSAKNDPKYKISTTESQPETSEILFRTAQTNVKTTISCIIDVGLFIVACWVYIFKDIRLVLPILALLLYRQMGQVLNDKIPNWVKTK